MKITIQHVTITAEEAAQQAAERRARVGKVLRILRNVAVLAAVVVVVGILLIVRDDMKRARLHESRNAPVLHNAPPSPSSPLDRIGQP